MVTFQNVLDGELVKLECYIVNAHKAYTNSKYQTVYKLYFITLIGNKLYSFTANTTHWTCLDYSNFQGDFLYKCEIAFKYDRYNKKCRIYDIDKINHECYDTPVKIIEVK